MRVPFYEGSGHILSEKQVFLFDKSAQPVILVTSPTDSGDKMNQVIYHYTIYFLYSQQPMTPIVKTISITFSESNAPKDKWDHQDAVEDYLVDFNPNPFEPIQHFMILKATK